jgi:signal transduction histidine kinase
MAGVGALAAAGVGYVVSKNPGATPAHLAATARVLIIATFVITGLYAQTRAIQARIGLLLVAAGLCSSLWLLNGSSDQFLFSVGVLFTGTTPVIAAYLLLAHPTGRLRSRGEQRFLWLTGGSLAALWVLGVLMTTQPPLKTPLLQCGPHCPTNVFSLGSAPELVGVVRAAMEASWVALTCGTAILLMARIRSASRPMRRTLTPVLLTGAAPAMVLVCYLPLKTAGIRPSTAMGAVYVVVALAIPLAILVGLGTERMFMAGALAEFVGELARDPEADPQVLMAAALSDPSLRVCYARTGHGPYVDSAGTQLTDVPADRAVTWIDRDHGPCAAVVYNADLADQERFVQAAGAAGLIRLERAQIEADLRASTADLAASRVRLVETAHAERRRLERDLHDGVQQRMVGLRLKLELAAEALKDDPAEAQRALAWIGQQMDDVLDELRSFARGIYPSLLAERGLREAIKAAARISPIPVEVRASGIERYSQDVEVAVYFCCLEAIQNAVKHGGPNSSATVTFWPDGPRLHFVVDNPGPGFDPNQVRGGSGLVNMRDRIEAVGGTLQVVSAKGRGVSVRGSVPVE